MGDKTGNKQPGQQITNKNEHSRHRSNSLPSHFELVRAFNSKTEIDRVDQNNPTLYCLQKPALNKDMCKESTDSCINVRDGLEQSWRSSGMKKGFM